MKRFNDSWNFFVAGNDREIGDAALSLIRGAPNISLEQNDIAKTAYSCGFRRGYEVQFQHDST